MIVLRLKCDSHEKFIEWAKANTLIEEREPNQFGQTLFNAAGFDYVEIGEIVKTPAVYSGGTPGGPGGPGTPGILVTPAVVITGHHVDCRFSGDTEARLTQGVEQTEVKTVTFEGQEVQQTVFKPASQRVTLQAVTGVTVIEPATPYHEWC